MVVEFFTEMKIDPNGYVVYRYGLGNTNISSLATKSFTITNNDRFFNCSPKGSFLIDINNVTNITSGDYDHINYCRIDNKYCCFVDSFERHSGSLYSFDYKLDFWHTYVSLNTQIFNTQVTRCMRLDKSFTPLENNTPISRGYEPSRATTETTINYKDTINATASNLLGYGLVAHVVDEYGGQYLVILVDYSIPNYRILPYNESRFRKCSATTKIGFDLENPADLINASCDFLYIIPRNVLESIKNNFSVGYIKTSNWGLDETSYCYYLSTSYTASIIRTDTFTTIDYSTNFNKVLTLGTYFHNIDIPFQNYRDGTIKFKYYFDSFGVKVELLYQDNIIDMNDYFKYNSIYTDTMRQTAQAKLNTTLGLVASGISLVGGVSGSVIGTALSTIPQVSIPLGTENADIMVHKPRQRYNGNGSYDSRKYYTPKQTQAIEQGKNPKTFTTYTAFENPYEKIKAQVDEKNAKLKADYDNEMTKRKALAIVGVGNGVGDVTEQAIKLSNCGKFSNYNSNVGELSPTEFALMFGIQLWDIVDTTNNTYYRDMYGYETNCYIQGKMLFNNFISTNGYNLRIVACETTILGVNTDIAITLQNILSKGVYVCRTINEMITAYDNGYVST